MAKIVVTEITRNSTPFSGNAARVRVNYVVDIAGAPVNAFDDLTINNFSTLTAATALTAIRNAAIAKYAALGGGVITATDVIVLGGPQ